MRILYWDDSAARKERHAKWYASANQCTQLLRGMDTNAIRTFTRTIRIGHGHATLIHVLCVVVFETLGIAHIGLVHLVQWVVEVELVAGRVKLLQRHVKHAVAKGGPVSIEWVSYGVVVGLGGGRGGGGGGWESALMCWVTIWFGNFT
jgi:hypothetical protein